MNEPSLKSTNTLPLVMVHGFMGMPNNWEGIIPLLPKTCQPVALHIPFFEEGTDLTNIPSIITYIQKYIDEKKFGKVILMGNSFGGHIAALFAARIPERVCGLVLIASSGLAAHFPRTTIHPSRENVHKKACETFYDSSLVTEEMLDFAMELITNRSKRKKLIRVAITAKRDNISKSLKLISCPTLLVWGKQDAITPPKLAEKFHSYIPNSELAWIDKCGHAPMIEHPQEFAQHLNAWLNKYFPAPTTS